jgi:hypothetical protein
MTTGDGPDLPRTEPELRAERLSFALRSLAAELVDERRKVAELRRVVAELRAEVVELRLRLASRQPARRGDA